MPWNSVSISSELAVVCYLAHSRMPQAMTDSSSSVLVQDIARLLRPEPVKIALIDHEQCSVNPVSQPINPSDLVVFTLQRAATGQQLQKEFRFHSDSGPCIHRAVRRYLHGTGS